MCFHHIRIGHLPTKDMSSIFPHGYPAPRMEVSGSVMYMFLCPIFMILFIFLPHATVSFTWVFICDVSQKTVIYNRHRSHVFPAQNDLKIDCLLS